MSDTDLPLWETHVRLTANRRTTASISIAPAAVSLAAAYPAATAVSTPSEEQRTNAAAASTTRAVETAAGTRDVVAAAQAGVSVPNTTAGSVVMTGSKGTGIMVGLPDLTGKQASTAASGTVVFADPDAAADVAVTRRGRQRAYPGSDVRWAADLAARHAWAGPAVIAAIAATVCARAGGAAATVCAGAGAFGTGHVVDQINYAKGRNSCVRFKYLKAVGIPTGVCVDGGGACRN